MSILNYTHFFAADSCHIHASRFLPEYVTRFIMPALMDAEIKSHDSK